jgi:hypothetical protein
MTHTWKTPVHLGMVAGLLSLAGFIGGFDQPKGNEKAAAKEQEHKKEEKKADEKKSEKASKHEFKIEDARYAEACSCEAPCACELIGPDMSCKGVGAFELKSAKYDGKDISGTKIAYALGVGKWVHVYVDQKDAKKREAAEAFAKTALAGFGEVKFAKEAPIDIEEKGDKYTVTVDGGKTLKFETEPVMGGDEKTPITYSNVKDPVHPVMMQGKAVSCTYSGSDKDGDHSFKLDKGKNAFFNNHIKSSGSL